MIENKGGGAAHHRRAAGGEGGARRLTRCWSPRPVPTCINPTLYPKDKLPYDPEKDFVPITGLVRINQALLAGKGLPANNVEELIALAKQKPGEITYGTAGVGSAPHMNIVKLSRTWRGVKLRPSITAARRRR